MTAPTAPVEAAPAASPSVARSGPFGAPAHTPQPPKRVPRSLLPLAEGALVLVSLTVVVGFGRLFIDGSFFWPLVLMALASHGIAIAGRRRGWSLGVTALVSLGGAVVMSGWLLYGETTTYGIPSFATLAAMRHGIADSWTLFQEVVAPAEVDTSFLLVAGLAVWVAAFVADWAAFRLWVPFEAIVAPSTVFVFCAMLGVSDKRAALAAMFAAAVIAFQLLHRIVRLQASTSWLTTDVSRGSGALLKAGAWLGGFAVLIGVVLGPLLPGDDSPALLPWKEIGQGPSSRVTVSPLVDIRGRLVDQAATEVFTVTSDVRSYWRLTALDSFDGRIWSSGGSYSRADGKLPTTGAPERTDLAQQSFTIEKLSAIWVPAAFEATSIDPGTADVRWDEDSATLIVDTDFPSSDGVTYTVESEIPRFTADELNAAPAGIPRSIAEGYLDLPGDFSGRVRNLAIEVVAEADTPYAKAMALQTFFRDNFTYSLDVPSGHSDSAIEQFLFETHAGYCEQFAGSYAAMARAVGLPSRVAVGFTPGDLDPLEPNTYHVRGEHAHAWPEIYFGGGIGWVAFEPTPGRGAPGAQPYTFVPESQAVAGNPGGVETVPSTQATVGDNPFDNPGVSQTTNLGDNDPGLDGTGGVGGPKPRPAYFLWLLIAGIAVAAVIALVLLYVLVVPVALWVRRWLRRRGADTPADRVRVAWQESAEAIAVLGIEPRPSETQAEFAVRSSRVAEPELCRDLARTVQAAEYSQEGVTDEDADHAVEVAGEISADVRRRASREQRVRAALDARPLLPGAIRRRRKLERVAATVEGPPVELSSR